jgi:hypothetical protein
VVLHATAPGLEPGQFALQEFGGPNSDSGNPRIQDNIQETDFGTTEKSTASDQLIFKHRQRFHEHVEAFSSVNVAFERAIKHSSQFELEKLGELDLAFSFARFGGKKSLSGLFQHDSHVDYSRHLIAINHHGAGQKFVILANVGLVDVDQGERETKSIAIWASGMRVCNNFWHFM